MFLKEDDKLERQEFAKGKIASFSTMREAKVATDAKCGPEEDRKLEKGSNTTTENNIQSYKRRFWILFCFFYIILINVIQTYIFSAILTSVKYVLEWEENLIALFHGLGSVSPLLFMVPVTWIAEKYGLRVAILIMSSMNFLSALLRCITFDKIIFPYLVGVSNFLNGMSGGLGIALAAKVSCTWFPWNERPAATAVASIAIQLGNGAMYLGPLLVRSPAADLSKHEIEQDIVHLMYCLLGLAALGFVCTLAYFPDKPPKPPSVSAYVERLDYMEGLKRIKRNPHEVVIILIFVAPRIIPTVMLTVLNFFLSCLGIMQNETAAIAGTCCVSSIIAALIVSRVMGEFPHHLKTSIIVLMSGAICFFLWLIFMMKGIATYSFVKVLVSVTCGICLQYSSMPLLIELIAEFLYPCPESVSGAINGFLAEFSLTLMYFLLMIPSQCFEWLTMSLVGSCFITILTLLFVTIELERSNLDYNFKDDEKKLKNNDS